ncbi:hypothetical protein U9M48_040895 [Paspalum notatum var. saurae]|uniref:Protein kinase domain-containing protein n=1 Tax=Paspalum notatum var. saurae TaxID=547442 RepID=A0AAQ3XCU1_PASNO
MFVGMLTAGKAVAQQNAGSSMTTLIKVGALSNTPVPAAPEDPLRPPATPRIWLYVAIGGIIAVACLFACSTIYVLWLWSSKRKAWRRSRLLPVPAPGLRVFSSEELARATNNLQEQLGGGSFGTVYKGELQRGRGQPAQLVAVKKLIGSNGYSERDFENEVRSIGQIHHCNLVPMVGYCNEGDHHRMLVFEYMPGGTLDKFIFGGGGRAGAASPTRPSASPRDSSCKPRIIHCDIKPDNILFDDVHVPRITDFGISKLLGDHMTQQAFKNTIAGTAPYIAPEWFRSTGKVGTMVDVYSFGVVLLEIICCKKAAGDQPANVQVAAAAAGGGLFSFPLRAWAEPLIRAAMAEHVLGEAASASTGGGTADDDDEEEQVPVDMESVLRFVAIWCLQMDPSEADDAQGGADGAPWR